MNVEQRVEVVSRKFLFFGKYASYGRLHIAIAIYKFESL